MSNRDSFDGTLGRFFCWSKGENIAVSGRKLAVRRKLETLLIVRNVKSSQDGHQLSKRLRHSKDALLSNW